MVSRGGIGEQLPSWRCLFLAACCTPLAVFGQHSLYSSQPNSQRTIVQPQSTGSLATGSTAFLQRRCQQPHSSTACILTDPTHMITHDDAGSAERFGGAATSPTIVEVLLHPKVAEAPHNQPGAPFDGVQHVATGAREWLRVASRFVTLFVVAHCSQAHETKANPKQQNDQYDPEKTNRSHQ